jgi:hypothetical protein
MTHPHTSNELVVLHAPVATRVQPQEDASNLLECQLLRFEPVHGDLEFDQIQRPKLGRNRPPPGLHGVAHFASLFFPFPFVHRIRHLPEDVGQHGRRFVGEERPELVQQGIPRFDFLNGGMRHGSTMQGAMVGTEKDVVALAQPP